MTKKRKRISQKDGHKLYEQDRAKLMADYKFKKVYAEEAVKKELWLQLAEAREAAGLTQEQLAGRLGVTQSQVSRMEKQGYDRYTLQSLRRYIEALGEGFAIVISVRRLHL